MTPQREIVVMEDGVEIYRGADKRHHNQDYQKTYFGIPVSDYFRASVVIISACIIATSVWVNLDNRVQMNYQLISQNSQSIKELAGDNAKILATLNTYIRTLDSFLSAAYGEQFDGGRPITESIRRKQPVRSNE